MYHNFPKQLESKEANNFLNDPSSSGKTGEHNLCDLSLLQNYITCNNDPEK